MKNMLFSILMITGGLSAQVNLQPIDCSLIPLDYPKSHPNLPTFSALESTNWSGYIAQNNTVTPDCGSVTNVYGSWTVPAISANPSDAYAALWVGIDGFSNQTVEQIGTGHGWVNGAQIDYAWFEMYPQGAYQLIGFPLNNGDVIGGNVAYIGNYIFELTLYNYTQGVYYTVPTSYTTSTTAARSSAEWIVEAPYNGGVLPLANFGTVAFNECLAVLQRVVGPVNNPYWMNDSLVIVDSTGTIKKDLVTPLSKLGRTFSVTWESK